MERENIRLKKRWGQNFLFDRRFLEGLAAEAALTPHDIVLEIGPGSGTLSEVIAARCKKLVAVEIDESLLPILHARALPNALFLNADFMDVDLPSFYKLHLSPGFKVVANLPYYITSPLIMKLLESGLPYQSLTVLLQKEVAVRMCAKPGTPDYGALSCAVQYYTAPRLGLRIPAAAFTPKPKVESQCITLTRLETPPVQADKDVLFALIHAGFAMRRKTLCNNLMHAFSLPRLQALALLAAAGIPEAARGETLSLADYARIANAMQAGESTPFAPNPAGLEKG